MLLFDEPGQESPSKSVKMADEDMPPPLEDMSETLEKAMKLRDLRLGAQSQRQSTKSTPKHSANGVNNGQKLSPKPASNQPSNNAQVEASPTPGQTKTTKSTPTPTPKTGSGDFCGMKKGFLFGGSSKSQKSKTESQTVKTDGASSDSSKQAESIPFIKPKTQEKDSGLKLDEVQKAMESTKGFLQDKEWVTDDLLEKVQKNETLASRMGDPRFMQAVTEFQTNPQAAIVKYQNNPEMQQFLKEFCGILGEHFTSLGDKPEEQSAPQKPATVPTGLKITEITDGDTSPCTQSQGSAVPMDPQVQQILSDPANQEILMDPKIQKLFENLRSDPEKAQRMLRDGDTAFRQKVDHLISLGLLKFQG